MSTKQEAQDALTWIKGEIPYLEKYLNGGFSDWPNTYPKIMERTKAINEKCKVIFSYAKMKNEE